MAFDSETEKTIKMCRYCYMCRHACPTFLATKLDSHTPRGYAVNLSLIEEGLGDWDDEGMERLFHCSQCGLCRELCEFHWPEDRMVLEGRRAMVETGNQPDRVKQAAEAMETAGVFINDCIDTSKWDRRGADVLLIAGSALLNKQYKTIRDAADVLDRMNTDWTMMREEDTGGPVLHELGYADKAAAWLKSFTGKIEALGPKMVVTVCPHMYSILEEPLKEKSLPIVHMVEFMADAVKQKRLQFSENRLPARVMYHDPCHIGRKKGIYDAPRTVLSALGCQVEEFFHCMNEAECCGAGGGAGIVYPEISAMVAQKRIEQALAKDIKTVVTACPNCKKVFEDLCKTKGYGIDVSDIVSLVRNQLV